ncbi:MAG: hypothetical protein ACRCYU_01390 [Nocardioides sp.]
MDLLTRYSNHAYTRAHLDKAVTKAQTPRLRPTPSSPQPHAMAQRMDDETRLRIADEYQAGVSPPLIGSRYGISRNSVMDIVAGLGVARRRPNMQPDQVDGAVDLYESGWSLARIGERLGFDPTTIRNRLLAQGVTMRDCHGRSKLVVQDGLLSAGQPTVRDWGSVRSDMDDCEGSPRNCTG